MYVAIGGLLTVCSVLEFSHHKMNQKRLFHILFVCMTLFLCLRYGQGSDYYAYYLKYLNVNPEGSFFVNTLGHSELGWYMLLLLSKRIGLNYELFIGLLSVIMMGAVYRAIQKYSPNSVVSLLLLYPTYYLTYFFSAMRQGLVMSLFLGFGVEWLVQKKYVRYYGLVLLLALFHKSAILLLVLPIALRFFENRRIERWTIPAGLLGAVFAGTGLLERVAARLDVSVYLELSVSYAAILLRVVLFCFIYILHKKICEPQEESYQVEDKLYILYITGFIVYLMMAGFATLSQRLTMPLKAIEIVLLPMLIRKSLRKDSKPILGFIKTRICVIVLIAAVILISNVELIKNIYSYIYQGNYYSWVNALNYPYSTIFNKAHIQGYISHFDVR